MFSLLELVGLNFEDIEKLAQGLIGVDEPGSILIETFGRPFFVVSIHISILLEYSILF